MSNCQTITSFLIEQCAGSCNNSGYHHHHHSLVEHGHIVTVIGIGFVFVTYVQQDHQDQRPASLVQSHRPPPQTPPPLPPKAPETRQSCTADRFILSEEIHLWILARLTSSISYWWFVDGGKSVKCIRKLADKDSSLSRCRKMGGFNKVCIFLLLRECNSGGESMKVIPTPESRALCVWDTDEYVSHILWYQPAIVLSGIVSKYERVCQQKHQLHELQKICNRKKAAFLFCVWVEICHWMQCDIWCVS